MGYLDGQKVGHFLITIQKSFKLIINQLYIYELKTQTLSGYYT